MDDRIILVKSQDLFWNFDSKSEPYYTEKNRYTWDGMTYVDPFPCYNHNIELVKKCVERVESLFPIGILPMYYILSNEYLARTNGQCGCQEIYDEKYKDKVPSSFEPIITLSGKRIPLHPAMTRYLIYHEYGHAVEEWIRFKLNKVEREKFLKNYCQIRGIEYCEKYGALNWHNAAQEVFANDFRIIIGNIESEFWPHNVPHPDNCKNIQDYWNNELIKLKYV